MRIVICTVLVLSKDELEEAVPGNVRKAEHFISLLKRLLHFLKTRLRTTQTEVENPLSFVHSCTNLAQIPHKSLKFCSSRLGSLLRTLEITDHAEFHAICM